MVVVMIMAVFGPMVMVVFHRGAQPGGNAARFCVSFGQGFDRASKKIGIGGELPSQKSCKSGKGDGAGGDCVNLFIFGSAAHVFETVEQASFKHRLHIGSAGRVLCQRTWHTDCAG